MVYVSPVKVFMTRIKSCDPSRDQDQIQIVNISRSSSVVGPAAQIIGF